MYTVGLSTCGNKPMNLDAFLSMREVGIGAVELCRDDYRIVDFKSIRAQADATGIELFSIHSHKHPSFDISSLDNESNRRAIKEYCTLIDRISEVGIDKIVIHPSNTPEPFDQHTREEKIKHAMSCLDTLAEFAWHKGVRIALENLPRACLGNTLKEHQRLLGANDRLCACLDLNHSLIDDTVDVIHALRKRIITIHVSDRDHINERHWMPGEGVLDWGKIMDAFLCIDYRGAWIYEVGFHPSATIERRTLTYRDFVLNAGQIFKKKPLTPIGTPFRHLGLWGPKENE